MDVVHGFDHVPPGARGSTIALGKFDGVHRGHQALLEETITVARRLGTRAAAMAFEPHPRELFHPERPHFRLTTLTQKLRLFETMGLDMTVVVAFDRRLAGFAAEEFVERVLVAGLGVRHVVVGYDFYFGKGRGGDAAFLTEAGRQMGFGVSVVAPVAEHGEVFSSSGIRAELAQGDVRGAAEWLGAWWRVEGVVVGGAKRGTGMGFPTANVAMPAGSTLAHGIYAVRVHLEGRRVHGAAYLGTRPTFDDGKPVLEVFLLDFDENLYGRTLEVEFIEHLRADRRFDSVEALVAQIALDCERARAVLVRIDADDPMHAYPMGRALTGRR
jgi:riboflavin kinase/FMN adenylyltransferase